MPGMPKINVGNSVFVCSATDSEYYSAYEKVSESHMATAGIVGILKKLGRDVTDKNAEVIVEGGLYEQYRLFRTYLHSGVKEMLHGKFSDNVSLEHWPDVCGIGSALRTILTSKI